MGLGGVGVLGFFHVHRWLFLSTALVLLGIAFYLSIIRRRDRLSRATFIVGAIFVSGMVVYAFLR